MKPWTSLVQVSSVHNGAKTSRTEEAVETATSNYSEVNDDVIDFWSLWILTKTQKSKYFDRTLFFFK